MVGWIKSYLAYSIFQIHIGYVVSEETVVIRGDSQGSVIGPILFIVMVNNLSGGLNLLFADNTKMGKGGKSADVALIQLGLDKTAAWAVHKSMFLNVVKSQFLYF